MRRTAAAMGAALLLCHAAASACGHCVEDKIAAVYDHAVLTRAKAQGHSVVFLAIDGNVAPSESLRRELENAARAIAGVDRDTVRVSLELAALSFAFDPHATTAVAAQRALEKKIAGKKLRAMELKLIEPRP